MKGNRETFPIFFRTGQGQRLAEVPFGLRVAPLEDIRISDLVQRLCLEDAIPFPFGDIKSARQGLPGFLVLGSVHKRFAQSVPHLSVRRIYLNGLLEATERRLKHLAPTPQDGLHRHADPIRTRREGIRCGPCRSPEVRAPVHGRRQMQRGRHRSQRRVGLWRHLSYDAEKGIAGDDLVLGNVEREQINAELLSASPVRSAYDDVYAELPTQAEQGVRVRRRETARCLSAPLCKFLQVESAEIGNTT